MDNLTHTLTGLMLSRAGLDKLTPRAPALLMLAANIPDLDVVSLAFGGDDYLYYHRWLTHALVMMPVMAMVPVLIVWLFGRPKLPWLSAWAISLVGIVSHVLLDWTNSYGIRFLLPFSSNWFALDITNVVDVWIWTFLILAISAPAISRLVSSEIGARKTSGRAWAIAALLAIFVYDTGRYVLHSRAVEVQTGRVYEGEEPRRVLAMPGPLNPFRWSGYVETGGFWSVHPVNLLEEFDPTQARIFFKPEPSPSLEGARQTPLFREFGAFSRTMLCATGPADDPPDHLRVECRDMHLGFLVEATVTQAGQVTGTDFQF